MPGPKLIKILDPRQEAIIEDTGIAPRLDLAGKVIGYRHLLSWSNFDAFLKRTDELLTEKYGIAGGVRVNLESSGHLSKQAADDFAGKIDAAILGLGN